MLFSISLALWREFGKRTQRSSILPSTPKVGGIIIADIILINTGQPSALMTRNSSRKQSKILNISSLILKFKKSPIKAEDLRGS